MEFKTTDATGLRGPHKKDLAGRSHFYVIGIIGVGIVGVEVLDDRGHRAARVT